MVKVKLIEKLSGSTLLESLVAMILLLICIILATGVINSIVHSSNATEKLRAVLLTQELMNQTRMEERYIDEDIQEDHFLLQKRASKYQDIDDIVMIIITAKNEMGEKLSVQHELVKIYP